MNPSWNISLFHYRNHGADYGSILVGMQVPPRRDGRLPPVPCAPGLSGERRDAQSGVSAVPEVTARTLPLDDRLQRYVAAHGARETRAAA